MDQPTYPPGVKQFLTEHRLLTLATVSSEQKPEAALVYYVIDDELNLYFATYKNSRKIENIRTNPRVAMVIGHEVNAVVLQMEGTAHVIEESNVKGNVLARLSAIGNQNPQALQFPPLLALSENSTMEFIHVSIDWFKMSHFESDITTIIEGKPANWKEHNLRDH